MSQRAQVSRAPEDLLEYLHAEPEGLTLAETIDWKRLPRQVAIIMDGNGRWAKERELPRVEGHRAGITAVREAVETAARAGLQAL
ncbi:MAG: undecaprenyl diphosphate synthase family protein, partial [Acidobacteriota bacterium]